MPRQKAERNKTDPLKPYIIDNNLSIEIGVDEAGKGPMFGRVYTSAVCLPRDSETFNHSLMKDSKRFHSDKKIHEAAEHIKNNALAWSVEYSTEVEIDSMNIRQATFRAMHRAVRNVLNTLNIDVTNLDNTTILVDGNDFRPLQLTNPEKSIVRTLSHICVEGGDNKYSSIAAGSILAKVSRDDYIKELVDMHPYLEANYGIGSNKGYGTKKHMDGIREYGITQWHRKTYGICRNAPSIH
jgi:ribonuclease HII